MTSWTARGALLSAMALVGVGACGTPQRPPPAAGAAPARAQEAASQANKPLWSSFEPGGSPTVVFISGNGNDHTVWLELEPQVRALGVGTLLYDRAGLGNSPLFSEPYRIDDEATALRATIESLDVPGPIVVVAHSYGGLIAALLAEDNPDVASMIYVDATLPSEMGPPVVESILAIYRPQYDEVRRAAPELASAVIPVVEAYPATAERMQKVAIDPDLPVVLIAAEKPNAKTEEWQNYVEKARAAFAAGSPKHELVTADGAGHNVMRDRPDVVLSAIQRAVAATSASQSP